MSHFLYFSPVNPVGSGREHAPFFAALPILMMARLNSTVHLSSRHRHVILMLLASATVGDTQSWDHVCLWVAALVERVCRRELCSVSGVMDGLLQTGQFIRRGFRFIQAESVFAHCHRLILTTGHGRQGREFYHSIVITVYPSFFLLFIYCRHKLVGWEMPMGQTQHCKQQWITFSLIKQYNQQGMGYTNT